MHPRLSALATMIAVAVGFRLAPYVLPSFGVSIDPESTVYPWNFSPLLPLCVFGSACFARASSAYLVPLAVYLTGDLAIWLVTGRADWAFYDAQPVLYLAVGLVVSCGFLLRRQRSWSRIAATGLASAVTFFVVSNFGVWALGEGIRYPHTASGLVDCYVQAIPFFRNTLISMAVFLPLLFSRVSLQRPAVGRPNAYQHVLHRNA